jgi:transposase
LRAILLERGIVAPQGKRKLEQFLTVLMDEQRGAGLSPRMITLIADARAQWAEFDQRIAAFDTEFIRWTKENEDARRLASIPGVGPTIASALIAAIGKGETFGHGRDLAGVVGSGPTSVHHRRHWHSAQRPVIKPSGRREHESRPGRHVAFRGNGIECSPR